MPGHLTLLRDYSVLDMTCDPQPDKFLRGSRETGNFRTISCVSLIYRCMAGSISSRITTLSRISFETVKTVLS